MNINEDKQELMVLISKGTMLRNQVSNTEPGTLIFNHMPIKKPQRQ